MDELLVHSQVQDKECEKEFLAEFRSNRSERGDLHTTEEEAKCQAVFRTTDYVFDKGKNPKRVLGTCEWFLYHLKYPSWLKDAETNWFWVTANPGCRKSVLAKHLVDTLDETKIKRESTICYFFSRVTAKGTEVQIIASAPSCIKYSCRIRHC